MYRNSIVLVIITIVVLSSCSPEWKIARTYIESKPDISLMIAPANYVFKVNLKRDELGDTSQMTRAQIDSLALAKSLFLKNISDSVFLTTFINSMINEFTKLGLTVYMDNNIDSFLFLQSPAFMFNIAQIELDEHYIKHEDEENLGGYFYHKTMDLNAMTFNNWFELTQLNPKKEGRKLFFASETISDIIDGFFTENVFTGEVQYKYQKANIDVDIIYQYCELLGQRYADYTYDYLMNRYIKENFPAGRQVKYYMHYNRPNHTLEPTWEDKFIEMN